MSSLAASDLSYPLPALPSVPEDLDSIDSRKALPYVMAFMKNTLIRALNNIYRAAPLLATDGANIRAFLEYVRCVCTLLRVHLEGDHLFFTSTAHGLPLTTTVGPACNPDDLSIHDSLTQLNATLTTWSQDPAVLYSADALRQALAFGPHLVNCMQTQLAALSFDSLSSAISDKDLREMIRDNVEWFASNSDTSFLLPFVISHHDSNTSPHWPTIHEQGLKALPTLMREHAGCWQFAPIDPMTKQANSWVH
ncbi:hypothetical protein BV22DRAFT_1038858 [Leucogyrophana mollusca]|uniref:Uncharacterized protein n=1 Tax=Leucogyrophana mollusca TaxID=85980 RepID=A0ACB8B7V3_9AGAM|nr:hypothetical protein BV22DRAFT_1038858 [Leucogyrophana mollusca]